MLDILLLLFLLLLSLALGERILCLIRIKTETFLEKAVFSIGLGLGVLACGVYLIGLLGLLYTWLIWLVTLVLAVLLGRDILSHLRSIWGKLSRPELPKLEKKNIFLVSILTFLSLHVIFNLIGALAPETIFDAIWYHLALPEMYLQNHKVFFVSYVDYAAFPRMMEMLYTLALALKGEALAKLIHFAMGVLIVLGIYSLSRRFFSKEVSLLAGAIFYCMQPVNMLSATAYIDLGLAFYELLAVYAFAVWLSSRERRWLLLSAVFLGFSLGIKHYAVLLLLVLVAGMLLDFLLTSRREGMGELIKNLAFLCLPAFLIVFPWYLDSYIKTGNPVYPLLNTLFGTGESWEKAMFASTSKEGWYHGHSLLEYFTLPWKFIEGEYEGWLSPLFLFLLPLTLLIREKPRMFKLSLVFGLLFYTVYFVIVPFYTLRYFLPGLPVLAVACAYVWERMSHFDRFLKGFCSGIVVVVLLANLGTLFFKSVSVLPVVAGLESREKYLADTLVWYDVNRYIRENLPASHKILVGGAPFFYYFDFNYVYGSGPQAASYEERARRLKEQGFTHILLLVGSIDKPEAARYFPLIYNRELPATVKSNATRGAKLYSIDVDQGAESMEYRAQSVERRDKRFFSKLLALRSKLTG
ncbi:MAG: glycosyltransferase family 39 protein [Actinomycetota bacterium]|nr:glycosyltransferase family 39 protein [Actinomycetota bacterium]